MIIQKTVNNSEYYLSYCKGFDDKWSCFDNNIVIECTFNDCLKCGIKSYILIYEKYQKTTTNMNNSNINN